MREIICMIILLIIVPFVYGQVWKNVMKEDGVTFSYLSGFFSVLAVFELIGPLLIIFSVPVRSQIVVVSMVLAVSCISILAWRRDLIVGQGGLHTIFDRIKAYLNSLSRMEWIYFAIFIILLLVQVNYALFYDIGAWRSDDATYIVISSAASHDGTFFATDYVTGDYSNQKILKYSLCGIFLFYTYISVVSGIDISVLEYTICPVILLLMSYSSYYQFSTTFFPEKKEKAKRYMFLILLSVIYMFGMYSHYSLTFRLLGAIWQGKAILAVVMIPFLLATYPKSLRNEISVAKMSFFMMISLATISLTMGGIIAIVVLPGLLTLFHLIKTRDWKCVIWLIGMEIFPFIDAVMYMSI